MQQQKVSFFQAKRLRSFLRGKETLVIFTFLTVVAHSVLRLALPGVVEKFIDRLSIDQPEIEELLRFAGLYGLLSLCTLGFMLLKTYLCEKTAWHLTDTPRQKALLGMLGKGQAFFNQYTDGEILERFDGDITILESFVKSTLMPILMDLFVFCGILVIFFSNQWILGVAFLFSCALVL